MAQHGAGRTHGGRQRSGGTASARERLSGEGRRDTHKITILSVIQKGADRLRAAGIEPTAALLDSIAAYSELLLLWNRKINLTTITDPAEILARNFVESFCGARWLARETGLLCDIGSGAGFPGLALKLVRPGWQVRLFEPNLKKAAFLAEVARHLGLTDVEVVRMRWEDAHVANESVEAVTARAVGGYEQIISSAWSALKANGRLLLWVGASEGARLQSTPDWKWETEVLPGSRERVLLVGAPLR
jgi:16S rRNA (guanine527-N7)-methyltransferase